MTQPDLSETSELTLQKVGEKWYYADGEGNFWRCNLDFYEIAREKLTTQVSTLESEKSRIDEKISSVNDELAALEGALEGF